MPRISSPLATLAVGLLLQILLARPEALAAQAGTPTAAAEGVTTEALAAVPLDALQPSSGPVGLARVTLSPGAAIETSETAGPALYAVTNGGIRAGTTGNASMISATTGSQIAPATPGAGFALATGDVLLLPAGATATLTNDADGPSEVLAVEFFARDEAPQADGATWQVLAAGEFELPAAGVIRLDRLTLNSGATLLPYQTTGPELIVVEGGPVDMALHPGEARIVRSYGGEEQMAGPPADPFATPQLEEQEEGGEGEAGEAEHEHEAEAATPAVSPLQGTVAGLSPGDAAFLQTGSFRTIRAVGETAAVLLVLGVLPA